MTRFLSLRNILLESLHPGTVVWDSAFVSMEPVGDGWKLLLRNGSSVLADIFIAADGANSRIRPLITPIRPFFAGMTAVEGAIYDAARAAPQINELLNGGKIFALGDEKTLIVSSKGDGSVMFYMGFNTAEYWYRDSGIDFADRGQVLAWFQKEFAGWDKVWLELPPYAGEGVNMAMLDALELSECLTSGEFPDLRTAIAHFEKQMCERASETAKMTLEQTASLHSANGLSDMLAMFRYMDDL